MLSIFTRCSLSLHILGLATLCVFYGWPSFPKTKTVVEPTLLRTTVFKKLFSSLDLYIYHNQERAHFAMLTITLSPPPPSNHRNNQLRYLINRFVYVIALFKILLFQHIILYSVTTPNNTFILFTLYNISLTFVVSYHNSQ